jgi:NTE family protein
MALDTMIASSLMPAKPPPTGPLNALVLMGGGARTAYQAGVLKGLGQLLGQHLGPQAPFPFQFLLGTSAGALNATYLASQATQGLASFLRLAQFWQQLHSEQVYRLNAPAWLPANLLTAGLTLVRQVKNHHALLDTLPLVDTLHRQIQLPAVEHSLEQGALHALAVTASSYTSGEHWTFCQAAPNAQYEPWRRPGRRATLQPITIEHLMASSAIPFLFPAVPLWVDGHKEFFGDGSMRQLSPLSPAIQLGARKVLVIGVGQPQRTVLGHPQRPHGDPTAGTIAGHAMASVFHDTLLADVEQAQRVSQTLARLPPELAAALPYRPVEVLLSNMCSHCPPSPAEPWKAWACWTPAKAPTAAPQRWPATSCLNPRSHRPLCMRANTMPTHARPNCWHFSICPTRPKPNPALQQTLTHRRNHFDTPQPGSQCDNSGNRTNGVLPWKAVPVGCFQRLPDALSTCRAGPCRNAESAPTPAPTLVLRKLPHAQRVHPGQRPPVPGRNRVA